MSNQKKIKIGIIGAGNMGAAILEGIHQKFSVCVCETDKAKCRMIKRKYQAAVCDLEPLISQSDILILAVKPQVFGEVLSGIQPLLKTSKLFISIAAGISTKYIEKQLGAPARVIRAMPNLPARVKQGMTGLCKGKKATQKDLVMAKEIFQCIGDVMVTEEKMIDGITAVSGSGPAYFFLFVEQYIKAAQSLGFKEAAAKQLVLKTLEGSLGLLRHSQEEPEDLRASVTSKGGTTFAALQVLMSKKVNYDKVFISALKAARKRAKELSK